MSEYIKPQKSIWKMKDGSIWEKELVEIFYFDLEGKIFNVVQYARDLNP